MFYKKFFKDKRALTSIEYGLLVSLLAIVSMGAWTLFGDNLSAGFMEIANAIAG
jgi:Flp pilus assembly pilin Flp